MARHTVSIINGSGSIELTNGTYNATAVVNGYNANTLNPKNVTIVDNTDTYYFTISADGVLTLHVVDNDGIDVVGARFIRTDYTGTVQGLEVTTNQNGNATFENVPFSNTGGLPIYYKQVARDGGHTFDDTLKSIILTEQNKTVEIVNPNAPVRKFTLMDANYNNIPINNGQIILEIN